jgi:uncharacterized protein YkuJ
MPEATAWKPLLSAKGQVNFQGNIVISLAFFEQSEGFEITQEQAELLGNIHFRKIDISDEIFVINVDGYIGNSTRKEIEYAEKKGKTIRYYSDGEIISKC